MAVGPGNSVYVGVSGLVWKIASDGTARTVAGTLGTIGGYSGEGGTATKAVLGLVNGLAVSAAGELYFSDAVNGRIFRVAANGAISTFEGGLSGPGSLAMDPAGNLYLAETGNWGYEFAGGGPFWVSDFGHRIRKITADAAMRTVAGTGFDGYSGDGGPAVAAQLSAPAGVATDAQGNVYVSDSGNHTVRKITVGGQISTVAGSGSRGSAGDGGLATSAQLNVPQGLAIDGKGNLYVAECLGQRVRKISAAGVITTVATAQLQCPHGVAVDSAGNLFIADTYNHRVRKVGTDGTTSVYAGNGIAGFGGDGGAATAASLSAPTGLALDGAGNLYVADTGNNRIRRVASDGTISTVAGSGDLFHFAGDDGQPATSAALALPQGVAVDALGNLYIADTQGNHIRRVSAGGIISTIAGRGLYGYLAYFDGNLNTVLSGYSGDGGPATSGLLGGPYGLAVDAQGNVYFADSPNGALRVLKPSPIANAASVLAGPIAVGEIVTLHGVGLGPDTLTTGSGGTQVLFSGVPGPVVYTSATEVAAVVPAVTATSVNVEVHYRGTTALAFTAAVNAFAPALFTSDSTGRGLASAIDADGAYNNFTSSAAPGDPLTLFATGVGADVTVMVGGISAEVVRVRPAQGLTGVTQIDITVPKGALDATPFLVNQDIHVPVAVTLQVGGVSSQPGVYITVLYLGPLA